MTHEASTRFQHMRPSKPRALRSAGSVPRTSLPVRVEGRSAGVRAAGQDEGCEEGEGGPELGDGEGPGMGFRVQGLSEEMAERLAKPKAKLKRKAPELLL